MGTWKTSQKAEVSQTTDNLAGDIVNTISEAKRASQSRMDKRETQT